MSRRTLVPLALVTMLVCSGLPMMASVLPVAGAQTPTTTTDPVGASQNTVSWTPQVGFTTPLYVNYPNLTTPAGGGVAPGEGVSGTSSGQPDCTNTGGTGTAVQSLGPSPRPNTLDTGSVRTQCPYSANVLGAGSTAATTPEFDTPHLTRGFNATTNDSLGFDFVGTGQTGLVFTITILRNGNRVTSVQHTIAAADMTSTGVRFHVDFPLPAGADPQHPRVEWAAGDTLGVSLTADDNDPTHVVSGPPQWTLSDAGSRVLVQADDSMRAASWVEDKHGVAKTLFPPYTDKNVTPPDGTPYIVGFFAVQSAFGLDDASSNATPQFVMTQGNQRVRVGPNGDGNIPAVLDNGSSSPLDGIAVWHFQDGWLDYRGLQPGEYNVTATLPYHGGGAIQYGTIAKVLITAQSVALTPYAPSDPSLPANLVETTSHTLAAGQTTTYLVLVNNTGAVNDSFRLDATPVSGDGWSIAVGGPQVTDRIVQLAPGESKLATVTIGAPQGAANGASSIFQLVATSQLDPNAHSTPLILTSSVTSDVIRDVGIIVPTTSVTALPGKEVRTPVYVWNRGTRSENLSLDLEDSAAPGWTITLVQGSQPLTHVSLPNVPAGAIASVDLSATGPTDQPALTHAVTLNATDPDVGGVATDVTLTYTLFSTTGVHLDVLDVIGGVNHTILVSGSAVGPTGTQTSCVGGGVQQVCGPDNGVDGALWRVWVTNTGRRGDTFTLSLDNAHLVDPQKTSCIETVFQNTRFGFVFKDQFGHWGDPSPTYPIPNLAPNQTAEIYVWKEVNKGASPMNAADSSCPLDTFSFTITATGQDTHAVARFATSITAEMTGGTGNNAGPPAQPAPAVLLEAAQRLPTWSAQSPLIDISQLHKSQILNGVEVNKTFTFYVRATDGSNFGYCNNANPPGCQDPTVVVRLSGVDREQGWNASIRPVNGTTDPVLNPYSDTVTFTNTAPDRSCGSQPCVEAFTDQEIEVRVTPPDGKNGTGLAGDADEITLTAAIGTDTVSTLDIRDQIVQLANLTLESDQPQVYAHPGENGAFLLYVNNTGSSPADVTLNAGIDPGTPNAPSWSVDPASTQFHLAAFKNTTIALNVKPPVGAPTGTTASLNVTISYAPNPFALSQTTNDSLDLSTQVVQRGALSLTPQSSTDETIAPGGFANYTMLLKNTGSQAIDYQLTASQLGNWTQTISPQSGTIAAGDQRTVVYVLKAPDDVVNDSRFSSIVRVVQTDNPQVFDLQTVNVNILGGKAIASLSVPKSLINVDRNSQNSFQVNVKNLGTATGRVDLSVRSGDPAWSAYVQDLNGNNISSITLDPNELQTVNVTVRAPYQVAEHTIVPFDVLATIQQGTLGPQTVKTTLQAQIHDYGVHIEMSPSRLDAIPGVPTEWTVQIRNDGNDNDTLNVSADLTDIQGWTVDLAQTDLFLQPGQLGQIKAIVKTPTDPLPTPRAYTLKFYVGTRGGQAVNLSKNESVTAVVNILNYRAADVDHDDLLELAVDYNKDPSDGFEKFVEIFPDGVQSAVVATGKINGKTTFFLDEPTDHPYDGIADVWFNPEDVYVFPIKYSTDINGDNSPDYLLDTDRDGKMDKAFDAVSGQFWSVTEIHAYGVNDPRVQFLVDTTGDGRPDRYYDPDAQVGKQVTRTINVGDPNLVGIDTDNTGKVSKVYDIRANTVSDAKVYSFLDFARQYWYFFVLFVVLVLVTIVLVSRRKRAPPPT